MWLKIIGAILVVFVSLFAVASFLLASEKREAEKELEKQKEKEQKKNEAKENLNGGNMHDNISNSLDLLQNNKKR